MKDLQRGPTEEEGLTFPSEGGGSRVLRSTETANGSNRISPFTLKRLEGVDLTSGASYLWYRHGRDKGDKRVYDPRVKYGHLPHSGITYVSPTSSTTPMEWVYSRSGFRGEGLTPVHNRRLTRLDGGRGFMTGPDHPRRKGDGVERVVLRWTVSTGPLTVVPPMLTVEGAQTRPNRPNLL